LNTADNVQILNFVQHNRGVTHLLAIGGDELGCGCLKRVFFLTSLEADSRGAHAHKLCTQWFTILSGKSSLSVSDGISTLHFELTIPGKVIMVPPELWVNVSILEPSIIAVFADQNYDENDYIRNWEEFVAYRERS
jgi:hypothetical protein